MSRKKSLATALVVSVILAACAAPTPEVREVPVEVTRIIEGTPETIVVTATPDAVVEEEPAVEEKELVVLQGAEPETMDLQVVNAQYVANIAHHINEALLDYNHNMEVQPLLATAWEQIEPDVWQFQLREGVEFSNGEPFNAEQVKFSYDRVMHPDFSSFRGETRYVERVEVVDEYTVNFYTVDPIPLFDLYTAMLFPIVPQGYVTEVGDEEVARSPIGTGPYVLGEWVRDDHLTLVKNPNYWGAEPKLDKIIFRAVPDIAARASTFLAGEADIVMDLHPVMADLVTAREELEVAAQPEMRTIFVIFNTNNESPVTDARVRQALNYAVDKEAIVEEVMDGMATVLRGQPVSSHYWGYNPDLDLYPYDPERAKELLAEAGYPDGFEIRMSSPRGRYTNDAEIAQALVGQLRDVGVRVNLETRAFEVHNQEFYTQEGGPLFLAGYASPPDAAYMLSIFHSDHPNAQHFDPEFDPLVDAAMSESDIDERLPMVYEALEYFRDEAFVLFLHQQWLISAQHERVEGFTPYPNGRIYFGNVDISGPRD